MRLLRAPRLGLSLAAMVAVLLLSVAVPVLDEESYLEIAGMLDPARPYDWWRPWPPWGSAREADAFVFAHPPAFLLWVHAWARTGAPIWPLKVAAGLPWAALLGWSVGRLAERIAHRPWLVAVGFLLAPITLLGVQRGLMPDLMVTALEATAVCWWLEGLSVNGAVRRRWMLWAGVAAGLAATTKYPALMVLPVLALHGQSRRQLSDTVPFWLAFAAVFLGTELWLALAYGRVHLVEVLSRAAEIPSGAVGPRWLGTAVRLSLGVTALPVLILPWRRALPAVTVLAGGLVWWGMPEGTSTQDALLAVILAALGAMLVGLAARELVWPDAPRADKTRHDGLLIGAWLLAVLAGVAFGHNFSAPRYLLPAMAPLALLVDRIASRRGDGRLVFGVGIALSAVLATALTVAEHQLHHAAVLAADRALAAVPAHLQPGCFTGEWAFRWRMREAGWTFCAGVDDVVALPPGRVVIGPTQSSPGELPTTLGELEHVSLGHTWLHVVDASTGVGLYSETVGLVPFSIKPGPVETVTLWQTR